MRRKGPAPVTSLWGNALCRFVLLYALLLLPWPGWNRAYGHAFRSVCRIFFSSEDGPREVTFEGSETDPANTRAVIADRALLNPDGSGPVRNLDLDTSGFWRATALLSALIVATPVSWRRRRRALLWGLAGLHALILLSMDFALWNESTHLSPQLFAPFRKALADGLEESLVAQFSIAAPVLLWVVATFRRGDERLFAQPPGRPKPSPL